MLKKLLLLGSVLALTSCDPFEGQLSVKYPFQIKSEDKTMTLAAGDYSAKLKMDGKKQIELSVKSNGKTHKIEIDLPKKLNLPDNGDFAVSAADLGQSFSAAGTAQTTASDSELRSGYEQCSYQRREHVCYPTNNGGVICRDEYRTVYGRQFVEYFDRTTLRNLNVNFIHANGALLSNFTGQRSSVERFYRHQGQCY